MGGTVGGGVMPIHKTEGAVVFEGPIATRIFAWLSMKHRLKAEARGMRFRRSTLAAAKKATGLRTNDRQRHIDWIEAKIEELRQQEQP